MEPTEAEKAYLEADCLFTDTQVQQAIETMSKDISSQLKGKNPLVLCVMTGAVIPAGHLLTRLNFPLQIDYIHATRYQGQTAGGILNWIVKPSYSLKERVVLIVDDIFDEGITLKEIVNYCREEGASAVYTAVLVNKKHDRKQPLQPDFIGLETEDRYLFGYGMDYRGYLRNAPGIYAVKGM